MKSKLSNLSKTVPHNKSCSLPWQVETHNQTYRVAVILLLVLSHLCLVISPCLLKDLLQMSQKNKLLGGCSTTGEACPVHCNIQPRLSCASAYHDLSTILKDFKSRLTLSLHLNLAPCAGRGSGNHPNKNCLGRRKSFIRAK